MAKRRRAARPIAPPASRWKTTTGEATCGALARQGSTPHRHAGCESDSIPPVTNLLRGARRVRFTSGQRGCGLQAAGPRAPWQNWAWILAAELARHRQQRDWLRSTQVERHIAQHDPRLPHLSCGHTLRGALEKYERNKQLQMSGRAGAGHRARKQSG
jgi:hypothetical protein